ncbi:hypothetical protein WME99_24475 [Sorangium sp. So ce136]|uniref:hypothetical protein n=1 Tax=Sorangium sp. So ce136 TaxID=3133284 RepID=UPI003F0380DB
MALMLGATAFSAGCGDDDTGDTGGGSTASSTTSATTGTTSTTGTGGSDEGGGGSGGSDEGGGGSGGEDAECVTCSAPLLTGADPDDLCESSKPKYAALTACMCEACGAAEGDVCYTACTTDEAADAACTECGTTAATTADGACAAEGTACLQDTGE